MRATRESIFWSAAERCADAGPALKRARAAGSAVSKPLWGRIGILFQKEKFGTRRSQSIPPSSALTNPRVRVIRDANTCTGDALMSRTSFEHLGRRLFLSLAFVVTATPAALSQTSTGSIRGYVTDSGGAALEGARVVAVSALNGAQREVTTQSRGFYAMLGLTPGEYDVTARQIGMAPQKIHVRVLIGQVYPLDFRLAASAIQVEAVTVVAASGVETRTSEVATNVTRQQVENLTSSDPNFLDLVQLAPGTSIQGQGINDTRKTFAAGALPAENVNVFIDGASYKNDLTAGGVAGQDASRGNPFPLNAIQEFRVITQNYKAEYQKASSGIITATTKSGGNQWQGSAFFYGQGKDLIGTDSLPCVRPACVPFAKPEYSRYQVGAAFGGPGVRRREDIPAGHQRPERCEHGHRQAQVCERELAQRGDGQLPALPAEPHPERHKHCRQALRGRHRLLQHDRIARWSREQSGLHAKLVYAP